MKNKTIFKILSLFIGLFLASIVNARTIIIPEEVTGQPCDAMNSCSEGLQCYNFPDIGLKCAKPDPCSYYKCPEGTHCLVTASYPGKVTCSSRLKFCTGSECPSPNGDQGIVSHDLLTKTEVRIKDPSGQTVSRDITLWEPESGGGNSGILKTPSTSVEYSNKLIVEESTLFMKTSGGKEPINIMPEDAVFVSRTPDINSVNKIELKEESQKPIYSIRGIKRAKILFLFPVNLGIETKVSAETGEVVSVKKPWWSFLAW